ncbi:hypothetical protein [Paludisphaera sp.]|uniref:hypothetical protein n=1 Tax=Paludisphaera sp. TaxID=2017432 RepID=UPI00301C6FDD
MSRPPKFVRRAARPTSHRRSTRRPSLGVERFEDRALLSTIVWSNMGSAGSDTDNFNATYGADAAIARTIVQTAIQAWERVIDDFNYANVGTPGNAIAANTYVVEVSASDLGGGARGEASVTGIDAQDKPFSAEVTMDDDGGGNGWYFDANPGDNAEFTDLLNRFTATFAAGTGNDFYRTIVHELGHAMGIASNSGLAIHTGGFLTPAGTDQNDPAEDLLVFTGAGSTATFTTNGGLHVYEGPVDPAFPAAPLNPFDLMNPGRTIGPPPTRQLITDLNASILRDAYGYTVVMPSTIQTFLANLNTDTGELTINGDVFTDETGAQTFVDDVIGISLVGGNLRVDVDGVIATFPLASITSWDVLSTFGDDQITIDFANGSPVPAGGGAVDGGPPGTLPGDTLTFANQAFNAPVVFTPSTTGPAAAGSVAIGGGAAVSFIRIETVAFASPILDFTYVTPPGVDDLTIDSPAAGRNRISGTNDGATLLPFTFFDITNFVLDTGIDGDSILLEAPGLVAAGLTNFTVDSGAGDDEFTIVAGADFSLPVAGGAFTYRAGGEATFLGDLLIVQALNSSTGEFRPDGETPLSGRFIKDGTTLFTVDLERAEINGSGNYALITPNDGDVMTITPESTFMNRIAGSSGGVAFSNLSFYNVRSFLIDSRSNNVGGLLGNRYTIDNPGGRALQATGLRNFTIRSSAGNDELIVRADDFRLPDNRDGILFDAGTGRYEPPVVPAGRPASNLRGLMSLDRIVVVADVDFTINNGLPRDPDRTSGEGRLSISPAGSGMAGLGMLGSIRLFGVEGASLTGGASNNIMFGTGFHGTLVLDGGSGDDMLVGGLGDNELIAGDGDDRLYASADAFASPGLGSQNQVILGGGGHNVLRGGPGRNTFHVDGDDGTSILIGGAGENVFIITNTPGGVVDPVGGIEVVGTAGTDDTLQLVGGGGAGYNQTYLLGPVPGAGNIVTTNNHVPNGPTISQFVRFSGIDVIEDTIAVDAMVVVGESPAAPIGGVSGADLAAGAISPTLGGLPFGLISFANKTAPSVQLANGRVVTPPAAPTPIPIAPAPAPVAAATPAPPAAAAVAIAPTSPIARATAVAPPANVPAPIAEAPAGPRFARRLAMAGPFAGRRLPRPVAARPAPARMAAFPRPAFRPQAFRPLSFAPRGPMAHMRRA